MKSDMEKGARDRALTVQECIRQLNILREKIKDVVANTKEHRGQYEVKVAEVIV
jgi:hypothetical protein